MIQRPTGPSWLSKEDQVALERALTQMDNDAAYRAWVTSVNDFFAHQLTSIYGFIKTILLEKDGLGEEPIKHAFTVLLQKSCEHMGDKLKGVALEFYDYGPLAGVVGLMGHQGQYTQVKFDLDFVRKAPGRAALAPQTLAH